MSRFGLARDIAVADDLGAAYRVMRADAQFARGDRVVVTREESAKLRGAVGGIANEPGTVKLLADDGDRLRFAVSSPKDTLLIVRDAYSQPVSAADEKGALDVIRINGAFIGIRVRSGESRGDDDVRLRPRALQRTGRSALASIRREAHCAFLILAAQ